MNILSKLGIIDRTRSSNWFDRLPTVALPSLFVACMVLCSGSIWAAQLVPTALDLPGLRPTMPGEGLLAHVANPYAQNANAPVRSGEEYTGWIDVRNPALNGPSDTIYGYDWYDRQLSQATTILKDRNNQTPQSVDVTRDLAYANTLYAREAGVSLIERSTRNYTSPAVGQPGSFDFPLSHGLGDPNDPNSQAAQGLPMEEQAIMQQNVGGGKIDVYYGQSLSSNANGETYYPSFTAGNNNEAIFMADSARRQTVTHEVAHWITDGDAIQNPILPSDPAHSSDPRNIIGAKNYRPGMPQNNWAAGNPPWNVPDNNTVAGPAASTSDGTAAGVPKVGGITQFTRSQVFTTGKGLFGDADVTPYLSKNNNETAANRVDWNFAADDWITEDLGGGADVKPGGRESLYFTAGNPVAPADPAATAGNGGKDKTGLGVFNNPGAWAGTFNYVDVFSLDAIFGDYDVDNNGNWADRPANLDYDVTFVLPNDTLVAGVPVAVYSEGWTLNSFADDWLARWMSPSPAKGVLVTAHKYFDVVTNQFIGNTQIDAVIAANFVPEPGAASMLLLAIFLLRAKRDSRTRQM
jgi:hypothetical protein